MNNYSFIRRMPAHLGLPEMATFAMSMYIVPAVRPTESADTGVLTDMSTLVAALATGV